MHNSRLAHWPPPLRDTITPPLHEPLPNALPDEPAKTPRRRNWFFKGKPGN
jgi:hypothetical protein